MRHTLTYEIKESRILTIPKDFTIPVWLECGHHNMDETVPRISLIFWQEHLSAEWSQQEAVGTAFGLPVH